VALDILQRSAILLTEAPGNRILGLDKAWLMDMLLEWFNVMVLVAVLALILYKPVREFLRKRSEGIRLRLAESETHLSEALALKEDYEGKLASIESERNDVLETARKHALEKSDALIADARLDADNIRKRAASDVEMEVDKAKDDIRRQIVEVSSLVASLYVARTIDDETQNRLVDEAIVGLEELQWHS